MPQSRLFDGSNNQLTTGSTYTRTAAWTAAAWVRLDETVGSDATRNYLVVARRSTTPYGLSGLRMEKANGRWVPSAYHDMATTDASLNGVDLPVSVHHGWLFVAGSHVTDGVVPRLWVGTPTDPIVEATKQSGQCTAGTGGTDTNVGYWQIGGYGANNILAGVLAWVAWWSAELTPGEIDTYRQQTAVGSWPNIRKNSLFGIWPLGEPSGSANARDLSGNARTLTATSMGSGDIGPALEEPADLEWWWRDIPAPAAASSQTVSPSSIPSEEGWGTPTVTVGQTVSPSSIDSAEAWGTPTVSAGAVTVSPSSIVSGEAWGTPTVSLDTGRTLNGTTDGFSGTGTAITGSWSWCGRVKLDTAGGYLWHTDASGTRIQSVSVETVSGKTRLRAYQARATTASQATWEIPLPTGVELALCVVYDSASGKFRAWAGTQDIPATELQWRYSQTVGAGASSGSGSTWSVSPSTGRVDGMICWAAVTDDVLTLAEIDKVRRLGAPPSDANLLGWWKLDETSGNAADSSGNGRTLTAQGAPGQQSRQSAAPAESTETLTLTSVADYQLFQRSGASASVPLAGTYTGSPSSIEARFTPFGGTPGSWTTVVASPAGGTWSATLTVNVGQGVLEVRANHSGVYAVVRRYAVAVGDLFFVVGTSNASGIETSGYARVETLASSYQFGGRVPAQLSNWNTGASGTGHVWTELHDPTDAYSSASTDLPSRTNSIFGPDGTWTQYASDGTTDTSSTGAGKSWVAWLAARCLAETAVPVAFAPLPRGGSNAASWMRAAAQYWDELRSRCEQVSGQTWSSGNPLTGGYAAGVLAVQGENDYGSDPTHYEAASSDTLSIRHWGQVDVYGEFGLPVHLMVVGDWPGASAYAQASNPNDGITRVRKANQAAWAETGILPGPNTYDLDLADGSGDGYHYRTDAEVQSVADRWWAVLAESYYGASAGTGRGPQVQAVTRNGLAVTVRFDVALDAAAGGFDGLQVYDGTPASGTRLTWVASSPASGQYTAVRDGADTTKVTITLGAAPSGTVYVGCGEWDLSAGKTVPSVTRTVGSVTVTLPAEVFSQVAAINAQTVSPSSITSGEAWGTPTVTTAQTVSPSSIPSDEAWGTPTVTPGAVTVSPSSIVSGEAWGTPTVSPGAVTVSPTGIASDEAWGTPAVSVGALTISPPSIDSGEQWGTPTVSTGPVTVSPSSIGSGEAWGTPTVSVGTLTRTEWRIGRAVRRWRITRSSSP